MRLYHGSNTAISKIDLPTLVKKISYKGDIHPQYYFGTEKAIELLKLVEYETVCRP